METCGTQLWFITSGPQSSLMNNLSVFEAVLVNFNHGFTLYLIGYLQTLYVHYLGGKGIKREN